MSIDRIGKGGAPPPTSVGGSSSPQASEPSKAFEIARPAAGGGISPTAAVAASSVGALERLRSGEIDLDGYLDLKVDEATSHLKGLRSGEVEGIRATLRDQIARDPALVELVQRATGETPTAKG